ncbi:hypothetical protein ACJIZ3_011495 [Penstemon smallii]|uniref:F-box domain-containing protein n=1 Tax=Penstemon smallii TaxID=265156 RepID=A0ABD3UMK0_9LAMI
MVQAERGNFVNNDENEVNDLPFDLINDNILPRLPVKSLVRFTSVCKTWETLIKSPQFVAAHLKLNDRPESKCQYPLILKGNSCYTVKNQIPIYLDKLGSENEDVRDFQPPDSCNGLILLKVDYYDVGCEFFLWNPSIRKYKGVNASRLNYIGGDYKVFGLGYHKPSDDYRVVRIDYDPVVDEDEDEDEDEHEDEDGNAFLKFSTKVEIYSLRTNSWRKVDLNPCGLVGFRGGVFLNGRIHWLANTKFCYDDDDDGSYPSKDYIESILFFDLEKECFGEIKLPENFYNGYADLIAFKEFQGSLAAIFVDRSNYKCFVWVMGEYGVTNSWHINLTIRLPRQIGSPLGFIDNGMLVCEEWGSSTKKIRKKVPGFILLDNIEFGELTKVINYKESLALLGRDSMDDEDLNDFSEDEDSDDNSEDEG